jgi:hypothetical protein
MIRRAADLAVYREKIKTRMPSRPRENLVEPQTLEWRS